MSKVLDVVRAASTVMDGAAALIASQKGALASLQARLDAGETEEAKAELAAAIENLEKESAELTAAMAENTSAAPAENPTPENAPVVDPNAVAETTA